jgi:hypothetical protein
MHLTVPLHETLSHAIIDALCEIKNAGLLYMCFCVSLLNFEFSTLCAACSYPIVQHTYEVKLLGEPLTL